MRLAEGQIRLLLAGHARRLAELMAGPDKEAANRVAAAMMQMVKLDLAKLETAAAG